MAGSRDLQEAFDWQERRNSWITNFFKNAQPIHIIGLALISLVGIYLISTKSVNNYVVYAALGVIVLLIIFRSKKAEDKIPIPENIIKIVGEQLMKRKVGRELPWGTTIHSVLYCGMRYEGEWGSPYKPWKWEVGFVCLYPDYLKKVILVRFHPYEGYITKITEMPAGYTGQESNDLKLMPINLLIKDDMKKPET